MERMEKKEKKSELEIELEQTIDFLRKRMSEYEFEYNKQLRDIKFLEEENKKLNIIIENTKIEQKSDREHIEKLEEENKKLNIKVASLEGEIKGLNSVIEKLHKEIEGQEAEGGGLFDEIDYRKREAKRLGWKPNK